MPVAFEIGPHQRSTRFVGFPTEDRIGVFENGAIRIEHRDTGAVIDHIEAHRGSFRGLRGMRRWSPLDALYFFGYALTHYHSLPFTLPEGRLISAKVEGPRDARVTVLDVELPLDLHTHCRRQKFYFGAGGKILRHDYHAEVLGFVARAAHHWNEQTPFNGFPVSLDRHVLARVGSALVPITALHATFARAEVELAP